MSAILIAARKFRHKFRVGNAIRRSVDERDKMSAIWMARTFPDWIAVRKCERPNGTRCQQSGLLHANFGNPDWIAARKCERDKMSARSGLLLLAAAACVCAAAAVLDTSKYPRSQVLKDSQMKIYWKVDGDTLKLALEATATGWVGFGLGETKGMKGADIVYYESAAKSLTDAYVKAAEAKPSKDTCQDWKLVAAETTGGKLIVEVSRKLVSDDSTQDRSITNDAAPLLPTPVIAAWGKDTEISYHNGNRVGSAVRFFGNQPADSTVDEALSALKAGGFSKHNFTIDKPGFPIPRHGSPDVSTDVLSLHSVQMISMC
jgi:hypothetical protein